MRTTSSRLAWTVSAVAWTVVLGLAARGGPSVFAGKRSRPCTPPRVGPDGRHLVQADGRPFFYLADTAWSLFHRLTREEADLYLRNRAAKGFTVIQAVALSENDGLRTPNAYGERPLVENDPRRPNETYFAHVDWVVDRAGGARPHRRPAPHVGRQVAQPPERAGAEGLHRRRHRPRLRPLHRPAVRLAPGDLRAGRRPERGDAGGPRDHEGLRGGPEGDGPEGAHHLPPARTRPLVGRAPPRVVARLQHDPVVPHRPRLRQRRQRRARPGPRAGEADPRRRAALRGPDRGLLHARGEPGPPVRRLRRADGGVPGAPGRGGGPHLRQQQHLADVGARPRARPRRRHALERGDRPPGRLPDGPRAAALRVAALGDARAGPGPARRARTCRAPASCGRRWRRTARSPSSTRPGASP